MLLHLLNIQKMLQIIKVNKNLKNYKRIQRVDVERECVAPNGNDMCSTVGGNSLELPQIGAEEREVIFWVLFSDISLYEL